MPDLPQGQGAPQPGAQPPPQGQQGQPQGQPGGGGMADALTMVDQTMTKIVGALSQNQQVPPNVKSSAQAALQAFRQFEQDLVKAAGGGGGGQEPDQDDQGGATTMQQGGKGGAVPMSHQNLRGR